MSKREVEATNMTSFDIERFPFEKGAVNTWGEIDRRHANWPVVYVMDGGSIAPPPHQRKAVLRDVYVGESRNAVARMHQHLDNDAKKHLATVRVIVDDTFNKSVCLDLESHLIRLLAGDGSFQVLNRNDGITEADYFDRKRYRAGFDAVFEKLRKDGVFSRSIPEIENSDLFKLSPFKALTQDQGAAVEDILEGLFADLESDVSSTIAIQGEPGTGKTVVAIYLLKLLADIAASDPSDDVDSDSMFSEFFVRGYAELLAGRSIGMVIPQQSLRKSVQRVFAKTPGLQASMVMSAFEVGESSEKFDLLIVDEAHRLNRRANQPSAGQNTRFREITERLFGWDDTSKTQLDWITERSNHQIFLIDAAQSVRPADIPAGVLTDVIASAKSARRFYPLVTQMRVQAGSDYVAHIRRALDASADLSQLEPKTFEGYDLRLFDDLGEMRKAISAREQLVGLSRLLAGYAWKWVSKKDKNAFDIEIGGEKLRWNSTQVDWIASPESLNEVGSIHTVQGYDLNYAGVIIGPDLKFDSLTGRLVFDRKSYADVKGKENNAALGTTFSDADLLQYVANIYTVLLTRGILGTYVYVVDPGLREHFRRLLPPH